MSDVIKDLKKKIRELKKQLIDNEIKDNNLIATNQQLKAHEQQLQAANQQLDATNQQLIANENELIKEKRFNENLINIANSFVVLLDTNANILLFNDYAEKLTEYKREDVLGKNWFETFIQKNGEENIPAVFSNVLKEMPAFSSYENEIKLKNGSTRLISWSNSVIKNEKYEIYGILSVGIDITEQRQIEENLKALNQQLIAGEQQLRAANDELHTNEMKFKSLFESMNEGVCLHELVFDEKGLAVNYQIIDINPRYEQILGLKRKDVINKLSHEVYGTDEPPYWKEFSSVAISGKPIHFETYFENMDTYFSISLFSPGKNKFATVFEDISERIISQKKLEAALEKAQESDRLKSAFLANMSHEIRTPMNGILGFSNLLKKPNLNEEDRNKYIEVINKSTRRMLSTINDLVDISRIEANQVEINKQNINLLQKMDELYNFFKPEADENQLELNYIQYPGKQTPILFTDRDKLYAILSNLLKNALKFTIKGSIDFGFTFKDEEIEFFVKDTGMGIPADKIDVIFERFIQADLSLTKNYEGSGLGLSISSSYAKLLDGSIRVDSKINEGSCFYLTLPLTSNENEQKPIQPKLSQSKLGSFKDIKILITEDDPASVVYLEALLVDHFKEVLVANNGQKAIAAVQKNPDIQLILMDIKMPVLDGLSATQQIRKFNQDVIIIAQSAYAMEHDSQKALEVGCNSYISKPINEEDLFSTISVLFEGFKK